MGKFFVYHIEILLQRSHKKNVNFERVSKFFISRYRGPMVIKTVLICLSFMFISIFQFKMKLKYFFSHEIGPDFAESEIAFV